MRRYHFLTEKEVHEALNRLRDAFLAAKDGNEVSEIISGLLTQDERIKLGRRIVIAEALQKDIGYRDLIQLDRVGATTVAHVFKMLESHPKCFELINLRKKKLEKEYEAKKYRKTGGSKLVFKKKEYTGLKRSDIKR